VIYVITESDENYVACWTKESTVN